MDHRCMQAGRLALSMPPKSSIAPLTRPARLRVAAPARALTASTSQRPAKRTMDRMPRWDTISKYLTRQKGLTSVPPGIAKQLTQDGYLVVDVRPPDRFQQAHIAGSVNVPIFTRINLLRLRPSSILRTLALIINGVKERTEANLAFVEEVEAAAGPNGKVILTCDAGGTLYPDAGFPWGKESRSLKAIFKLLINAEGKLEAVQHLDGGISAWSKRGLPMVGQYDGGNLGRTPHAAGKTEEK